VPLDSPVTPWHQFSTEEVLRELGADASAGLSEAEAGRRLAQHGRNELASDGSKSAWLILWDQLTSLMVVILIVAAVVSALLGDHHDAIAITAIVILNAVLGFSQEYRAEKALSALKKLAMPVVRVRRSEHVREVPAGELVPGDIVLLEAGNFVAADCRVLESAALEIQEAALTGESQPIHKLPESISAAELPLGDRRNMAYMGTFAVSGRGLAVVVATGMRTELGRIARMIQSVHREATPLQRRLDQLGKRLAAAALFLVALIFFLGLLRGEDLKLMLLTAVSIGVAAVPEGLPAIVTIALTLGAQRMLRRRALIRKLPAVETLGSVTVICSDKTGTLTENRMTVTVLQTAARRLELDAAAPSEQHRHGATIGDSGFTLLLTAAALCNDALLPPEQDQSQTPVPLGDPTEVALLVAASRFGLTKQGLEGAFPRIAELPFSSERKRMTTVHALPREAETMAPEITAFLGDGAAGSIAFTKGSVEGLLDLSEAVWVDGRREALSQAWRQRLTSAQDELAEGGMRVLGIACRALDSPPPPAATAGVEQRLTFVGMFGMMDPPRPEAASAVTTCRSAGIRVVMITGDHALTARSISRQLGIGDGGRVVAGTELEKLSVAELEEQSEATAIYARVSPEHKLKIVEALQRRGNIVAMTGDGVNDAPALKKAAIGIAMGRTGTDVAKEAADMVLVDDNFATIVAAVEEGRVIYDNVRKFIKYILATNSGEIWIMLMAPFAGMPLPLLPLQILWMNLVTDGLPALALGLEPAEHDTMRRPPYPPQESIFARGMGRHVIWVGLLMAIVSLGTGFWYWREGRAEWQTMLFTTLTLSQMAHILAIRSERNSIFRAGLFSNTPLLGAVILTTLLQISIVQLSFLQGTFQTVGLSTFDLLLSLLFSSTVFWAVELEKWWMRRSAA
jgi:Ca2+-transporting ATPase